MPKYVCSECGEVFGSKEAKEEHGHEDRGSALRIPRDFSSLTDVSIPRLSLKQLAVLGGVFLMSTLFMGTVFFGSSLSPSSPGSGGGAGFDEPSPPVGYSIQSQADIPQRSEVDLPGSAISQQQLSTKAQLYLLTRPVVLLQYSCVDCPGTVQELGQLASDFNAERDWVYVAPYRDMNATISLTAFRQSEEMDSFNRSRAESFVCSSLNQQPVPCAFR